MATNVYITSFALFAKGVQTGCLQEKWVGVIFRLKNNNKLMLPLPPPGTALNLQQILNTLLFFYPFDAAEYWKASIMPPTPFFRAPFFLMNLPATLDSMLSADRIGLGFDQIYLNHYALDVE
jgi:hypothetical protein